MSSRGSAKREKLYEQQNGKCFWCGYDMLPPNDERINHPLYPTLDHIIPKATTESGTTNNIRVACKDCNYLRGCYNTGLWKKEREDEVAGLKANIAGMQARTGKLKAELTHLTEQNKRLTDSLLKYIEDHKPKETVWKIWIRRVRNFLRGTNLE